MPTDHERLLRQKSEPSLLRLHRSLSRLSSVLTVMNTGAHPDDEQSGLLALFRYGFGMRVVVACSTRGEGGQNALGPERTGALGVLRTREMEEAARELDADIAWLGHGPDDPVHDFGFSKNGDATLARWGEERLVERLVRAYRTDRPDIVIPTFLDVPGQHGHHRAMTRAAGRAVQLASDPDAFPEHRRDGLKPWQVAKFYLPAWSGGGGTYDDEVPPPAATVTVTAPGRDVATGAAYDQIGEWSRRFHASQGMGVWNDEPKTQWQLHLVEGPRGPVEERAVTDELFATLGELALCDELSPRAALALRGAQNDIDRAQVSLLDRAAVIAALAAAARQIEEAKSEGAGAFLACAGHRLDRKLTEIDHALAEASGLSVRAAAEPTELHPGGNGALTVHIDDRGHARDIALVPHMPDGVSSRPTETTERQSRFALSVDAAAPLSVQYPPYYSSLGGNGPAHVEVRALIGARTVAVPVDLETALRIGPACSVKLEPDAILARLGDATRAWDVRARTSEPADVAFAQASGWRIDRGEDCFVLSAPETLRAGCVTIAATTGDGPAFRRTPIRYPHIGESTFVAPEAVRVLALDLELPAGARIGYVGGGADRVGVWLKRMGLDVTELTPADLPASLSRFTTIVVGIFAFGLRRDLHAARARLHRYVEKGGHLVTLYHRPSDGWDPAATPPRRLEIGTPSLRWRVTDPAAAVTVLTADHPLLAGPNVIGPADWAGWDKERGLYFAARWDEAYTPLLAMHDEGEAPLKGALVSAEIGNGRHTHVSLVLHHQMDRLVPGAFRLMANLVQPAR